MESDFQQTKWSIVRNSSEERSDVIDISSPTKSLSIEEKILLNRKKPNHFITLFPMKHDSSSNNLHGSFSIQDRPSIVSSMNTDTTSSVESDYEFPTLEDNELSDQSSSNQELNQESSRPTLSQPTISVGRFFSKVVKSMFSEEKPLAQNSSVLGIAVSNVVQKFLPVEKTVSSQQPTQLEDEPLPMVSNPSDLIPYYRRRYLKFRKVSLALTREWRMYYIKRHNYEVRKKKGFRAIPPPSPKPTPSPPPIHEKADFNGMDPPNANYTIQPKSWFNNQVIQIRYFKGNTEVTEEEVMYDGMDNPDIFSFALISVTTYSRLFFISHLLKRWQGY